MPANLGGNATSRLTVSVLPEICAEEPEAITVHWELLILDGEPAVIELYPQVPPMLGTSQIAFVAMS